MPHQRMVSVGNTSAAGDFGANHLRSNKKQMTVAIEAATELYHKLHSA